ncbi:MAG TPA: hypothetical protein VKK19_12305 [Candidatus Dormibacteraeota bacterium]|nr:hypothetical protein [Candidatus Dormibacteraeota bacterium]
MSTSWLTRKIDTHDLLLLQRLRIVLEAARDPGRAAAAAAYTRNQVRFLGIGAPQHAGDLPPR